MENYFSEFVQWLVNTVFLPKIEQRKGAFLLLQSDKNYCKMVLKPSLLTMRRSVSNTSHTTLARAACSWLDQDANLGKLRPLVTQTLKVNCEPLVKEK